ncbi:MAG: ribbon-helix-helix domain-containing protein [Alphaproteobacteria bacterium]
MNNSFVLKNFYINGNRTSIRLDQESVEALNSICDAESVQFNQLMQIIEQQREKSISKMSRTAYLRTFLIHYLKQQIKEQSALAKGDLNKIEEMAKGRRH